MPSPHTHLDALAVDTLRALTMDAVEAAKSGHPGAPMSLAPLGWTIFTRLARHDPTTPSWPGRDRFVLSAGHASMLQYGLLHLTGYGVSLDDIKSFRQWGSNTPGHPEYGHTPGVEATTGPLGQGFAHSVGMAMAARHLSSRFDRPDHALFDHRIFVIASDGDTMEGVVAESASLAGHLGLGQLVVFWDDNRITIDGRTDISFTEDVLSRFAAYGWHTASVDDGGDMDAIENTAREAMADPRPSLIRVRTIIGYPAPTKKDSPKAHGSPLGEEEVRQTKELMGWPLDELFLVPEQIEEARRSVVERGRETREDWNARVVAWKQAHQDQAPELDRILNGEMPAGWDEDLPAFETDADTLHHLGGCLGSDGSDSRQSPGGSVAPVRPAGGGTVAACRSSRFGWDGDGLPRRRPVGTPCRGEGVAPPLGSPVGFPRAVSAGGQPGDAGGEPVHRPRDRRGLRGRRPVHGDRVHPGPQPR